MTHGNTRIGRDAGSCDDDDLLRCSKIIGNVLELSVVANVHFQDGHAGPSKITAARDSKAGNKKNKSMGRKSSLLILEKALMWSATRLILADILIYTVYSGFAPYAMICHGQISHFTANSSSSLTLRVVPILSRQSSVCVYLGALIWISGLTKERFLLRHPVGDKREEAMLQRKHLASPRLLFSSINMSLSNAFDASKEH